MNDEESEARLNRFSPVSNWIVLPIYFWCKGMYIKTSFLTYLILLFLDLSTQNFSILAFQSCFKLSFSYGLNGLAPKLEAFIKPGHVAVEPYQAGWPHLGQSGRGHQPHTILLVELLPR